MSNSLVKLDAKDKRILYELELDCRLGGPELAKRVGISKQVLSYRISRLMKEGVILSFLAAVNVSRMGYANHEVWMQLPKMPESKRKELEDYLCAHASVRLVAGCGGKYDLLIGILAKSVNEFNRILKHILAKFPGCVNDYAILVSTEFYTYPKTYLINNQARKKEVPMIGSFETVQTDSTDQKILAALSSNARAGTIELANRLNLAPNTVRSRIKGMERSGIIEGYKILIDHQKTGYENYEILASMRHMHPKKEEELEEFCRSNPYSTFLLKCVGKWDVDIGFDCEDNAHFQKILVEFRDRFGDIIQDYEVVPVMGWRKFTYYPFHGPAYVGKA